MFFHQTGEQRRAGGDNVIVRKILLGVPLHADSAGDHDAITQVKGSFEETMLGLYNLGRYDIGIELRVVITKMNYLRLPKLPDFIYRNLPFVEFISLMGLEYTGYMKYIFCPSAALTISAIATTCFTGVAS